MNFLPIVERELRVRARGRALHWGRFAIVLSGALVCVPALMLAGPAGSAAAGLSVFRGLVGAAFLLSCAACFLTADVISSERREGTLGLLFLTRVKSFDVLLGKLASAGLAGLCALMACLPLLMIPILAGGVTGGEAFRKGLVLLDTLFLALAAGIWASARGSEWFRTGRAAISMVALIVVVPGLSKAGLGSLVVVALLVVLAVRIGIWARGSVWLRRLGVAFLIVLVPGLFALYFQFSAVANDGFGLLSPLVALFEAGDANYKLSHERYWISLALVQGMGWGLLMAAGVRLRRSLREVGAGGAETRWAGRIGRTGLIGRANSVPQPTPVPLGRGRHLRWPLRGYASPIEWLLDGQRGVKAVVWTAALLGLVRYGMMRMVIPLIGPNLYWMGPFGLAVSFIQGTLFAWAVSRFFVEAQRTGELEVLRTTPLGAATIVSAQWTWLKRIFQWPVAVMVAPILMQGVFIMFTNRGYPGGSMTAYFLINSLLSAVDAIFGVGALCWLGLWFGLRARGQVRAIFWTVGLAKGVPFLIMILWQMLLQVFGGPFGVPFGGEAWILFCVPQVLILCYCVKVIGVAKESLRRDLAPTTPRSFSLSRSLAAAKRQAAGRVG